MSLDYIGELPEVREYKEFVANGGGKVYVHQRHADAAIAALEAENKRLKWTLDTVLDDLSDSLLGAMPDAIRASVLADIESRWAERGAE